MQTNRSDLLHWCVWFFLGNVIFLYLIGLNYLSFIPWMDGSYVTTHGIKLIKLFVIFSFLGQFGLLGLLPCCFFIPLIFLFPRHRFVVPFAVIVSIIISTFLMIDQSIYKIYRFHLHGIMFDLFLNGMSGNLLGISSREYCYFICALFGISLIEIVLAIALWYCVLNNKIIKKKIKWFIIFIGLNLYISYLFIFFSAQSDFNRILLDVAQLFPFYKECLGGILKTKNIKYEAINNQFLIQPKKINQQLLYPLGNLQFSTVKKLKNVVVIGIDAWRFNMLNNIATPNIAIFAKQSLVFNNHFSGGDATGPGIFSLFYGLPASYWTAMEAQKQGPVLMKQFVNHHYRFGIYASSGLDYPPFNCTVFTDIKSLEFRKMKGNNPFERDNTVTQKFKEFIKTNQKTPFFSFLFYDAAHSYCSYDEDRYPLQPISDCNRLNMTFNTDPLPYLNRYENALMLVDNQVGEVISILKSYHLLDNTIVIITGDHGEEFNDNGQGFWGHASNFTHFQVQTPLLIYWPGKKHKIYTHQTTHFDIAPTLMAEIFGCKSNPKSYSEGTSLFDSSKRPYLIVNSYISMGILETSQITDISSTGQFKIEGLDGTSVTGKELHMAVIKQVFKDLRRFYAL